jgi:hypothetical protein
MDLPHRGDSALPVASTGPSPSYKVGHGVTVNGIAWVQCIRCDKLAREWTSQERGRVKCIFAESVMSAGVLPVGVMVYPRSCAKQGSRVETRRMAPLRLVSMIWFHRHTRTRLRSRIGQVRVSGRLPPYIVCYDEIPGNT